MLRMDDGCKFCVFLCLRIGDVNKVLSLRAELMCWSLGLFVYRKFCWLLLRLFGMKYSHLIQ